MPGAVRPAQRRKRGSGEYHVRERAARRNRKSPEFHTAVIADPVGHWKGLAGGLEPAQVKGLRQEVSIAIEEQVAGLHVSGIRLLGSNKPSFPAVDRPHEDASGGGLRI